jgi:hypothetical protein
MSKDEVKSKLMYPEGDGCYLRGIEPERVYLAKDYESLKEENKELRDMLTKMVDAEPLDRWMHIKEAEKLLSK